MDVAHNPAGAWALRSTLSTCYEDRRIIFVFGAMRDKAISEIAEILFPLAERIIVTRADNPRSASPEEIRDAAVRAQAEIELAADVVSAVERAREVAFSGELVADGVSRASLGGQPGAAVSTCAGASSPRPDPAHPWSIHRIRRTRQVNADTSHTTRC